jgi:hypothetical protein
MAYKPQVLPRVYRAFVTQTGTDAPVSTIIENTLGFTPVWQYLDAGVYVLLYEGGFPVGKTFGHSDYTNVNTNFSFAIPNDGFAFSNAAQIDGTLVDAPVSIYIYP